MRTPKMKIFAKDIRVESPGVPEPVEIPENWVVEIPALLEIPDYESLSFIEFCRDETEKALAKLFCPPGSGKKIRKFDWYFATGRADPGPVLKDIDPFFSDIAEKWKNFPETFCVSKISWKRPEWSTIDPDAKFKIVLKVAPEGPERSEGGASVDDVRKALEKIFRQEVSGFEYVSFSKRMSSPEVWKSGK